MHLCIVIYCILMMAVIILNHLKLLSHYTVQFNMGERSIANIIQVIKLDYFTEQKEILRTGYDRNASGTALKVIASTDAVGTIKDIISYGTDRFVVINIIGGRNNCRFSL